jgi:uncharacterized protein YcaQ
VSATVVSVATARRVAVNAQRLVEPTPPAPVDADGIHALVHHLGCLQLDPTNVVARNPELVLWSRLGQHDRSLLPHLLFHRRALFEYWAHAAAICDVDDLPIHRMSMRAKPKSAGGMRAYAWLAANASMRRYVLTELRRRGPLEARELEDRTVVPWESGGWTSQRNVTMVLELLYRNGRVLVAGRRGTTRRWDLAERVLPPHAPSEAPPASEVVRRAALRAIRALGLARVADIREHFTRGRYPGLPRILARLEAKGVVERVRVDGLDDDWLVHADDVPLLREERWTPRTTLLSPFDNLICDRARTRILFGMDVVLEIYTPKAKRRWGYFVLPVLHGHDLVARLDLRLDRATGVLHVEAVHAEPGVACGVAAVSGTGGALVDLAGFVGATDVALPALPLAWTALRAAV